MKNPVKVKKQQAENTIAVVIDIGSCDPEIKTPPRNIEIPRAEINTIGTPTHPKKEPRKRIT